MRKHKWVALVALAFFAAFIRCYAADSLRPIGRVAGSEPQTKDMNEDDVRATFDPFFVRRDGGPYTDGDVDMPLYGQVFEVYQRSTDPYAAARFVNEGTTPTLTVWNKGGSYGLIGYSPNGLGTGVAGSGYYGLQSIQNAYGGSALTASGNINLVGAYDEIQLYVKGILGQTQNIFNVDKSNGTDLFTVSNAGLATMVDAKITGGGGPTTGYFAVSADNNGTVAWRSPSVTATALDGSFVRRTGANYTNGDALIDMRLWTDPLDVFQMTNWLPAARFASNNTTATASFTNAGSGQAIIATSGGVTTAYVATSSNTFYGSGGTMANVGPLAIYGYTDTIQGYIQGNLFGAQTANIFNVDKGDGTDLFTVDNSGLATAVSLKATDLTATRVTFATTGGQLTDDSAMTYDSSNDSLDITGESGAADYQLKIASQASVSSRGIKLLQANAGSQAAAFHFYKGRGTPSSPTAITNGDGIGVSTFWACDSTNTFRRIGGFGYNSNGTVGNNSIPGDLYFYSSVSDESAPFTNGTVYLKINSGGNVAVGSKTSTATPTWGLTMGDGTAVQDIGVQRQPTAATNGFTLRLNGGGAYSGGSNLNGGNVTIRGGIATGNGTSGVLLQACGGGSSGTADATPATVATVAYTGVSVAGNLVSTSASGGVGYATGAGGTVTQATNKSTGVTINKVSGAITMNNANLVAGTAVGFTVTNSTVAATDTISLSIKSGATADSYLVVVDAVGAGSFRISLHNTSGGDLAEAVVINFNVIKGVTS